MKIFKFGGTSVKNASAMDKVFNVLNENGDEKKLVVLSACGGITNKITASVNIAANDDTYLEIIDQIEKHHFKLIDDLIKNNELQNEVKEKVSELITGLKTIHEGVSLLNECTPKSLDHALSYGELLSTTIFYYYLLENGVNAGFSDSRKIIKTDNNHNNASVKHENFKQNINSILKPLFDKNDIIVIQGFIATDDKDQTTTLGRGGSDYTASLYGAGLKEAGVDVDEIQIWTDVSGVLSGDPRKLLNTKTIPLMTFNEIRELSFYGAKVLHPNTIKPAYEANIPVRVMNTFVPLNPGTKIVDKIETKDYSLHSAVLKENCILLRRNVPVKENSHEILSKTLKELLVNKFNVLFSNSTESSITIIIEEDTRFRDVEHTSSEKVSIICVSGTNITTDTQGKILIDLADILADKMPLKIVYGSSDVSILLTYKKAKAKKALKAIHGLITKKYLD